MVEMISSSSKQVEAIIFDAGGEFDCQSLHTMCVFWHIINKQEPITASEESKSKFAVQHESGAVTWMH